MMLPAPGSRARVTRHLQHIQPLTKKPGGKFARKMPFQPNHFVQPKDRIAFWNIGPGDEVRVTTGGKVVVNEDGTKTRIPYQGIVDTIDRETNVVYLRAPEEGDESLIPRNMKHITPRAAPQEKPGDEIKYGTNVAYAARPVHYSNLQLRLPSTLALPDDVKLDLKKGVYAARITRSEATFNKNKGIFTWRRYAVIPTTEGSLKIEVPWPRAEPRKKPRTDTATLNYAVEDETWLPWSPEAPTWLLPFRKRTSPHAMERHQAMLARRAIMAAEMGAGPHGKVTLATAAARAAAQAAIRVDSTSNAMAGDPSSSSPSSSTAPNASLSIAASMLPGYSTTQKLPVYEGFIRQLLPKPKRPILPQPASPAEQIWMRNEDMREWYENSDAAVEEANEGQVDAAKPKPKVFSALDYLELAPSEGCMYARRVASTASDDGAANAIQRDVVYGTLSDPASVTADELNSWPIELMMKDDLINEQGSKHRRIRWRERQLEKAALQEVMEENEAETLRAFRAMKLQPSTTMKATRRPKLRQT